MNAIVFLPLTGEKVSIIDFEDFEQFGRTKWRLCKSIDSGYACRTLSVNGKTKTDFLHRAICGSPSGLDVDHINGNGLDNRRCNLRVCSRSENLMNQKISKANKTGVKGVHRTKSGVFVAQIKKNGKGIYLGRFDLLNDAALARIAAEKEMFGQFSRNQT